MEEACTVWEEVLIDQKEESLVIPLTLDYEAPTLLDSKVYEKEGRTYLEFEAYDNHYLSYFGFAELPGFVTRVFFI